MTTTISIDSLRGLAGFWAERGCAISLYLDLDPSRAPTVADVQARIRSLLDKGTRLVRGDLGHEQREGVRADLERLERFFESDFDRDGASGFAVFAAGLDGVWSTLSLTAPVADSIRIGGEFHLAPLVPLIGRGEGALVAAVNRERGSIYRLRAGKLVELVDLTKEMPGRHDQGGWSQANYRRHIDNIAHEHFKAVAEELERRFHRLERPRIVMVCPEEARHELGEALASDVAEAVIGWTTAEAHASPAELAATVGPVLDRWRAACEAEHLERWQEGAGRGGRAASGWKETLEAASDGRVELLLYQPGAAHDAVRCPRCGRVQLDGDSCPLDGAPLEPTREGLDLAVRQTLAQGGSVWALRHRDDLLPVGGIGALLRY